MTYLDRKRRISIDVVIEEIKKQKSFQQPDNASGSFKSVLTGKNIVCYVI